jgi:hypothetical protein
VNTNDIIKYYWYDSCSRTYKSYNQ